MTMSLCDSPDLLDPGASDPGKLVNQFVNRVFKAHCQINSPESLM